MNSALASLTETYTDSENEDHREEEDLYSDPEEKQIKGELVTTTTNSSNSSSYKSSSFTNPKKSLRLVSYNDNEEMHDGDHHSGEEEEEEAMEEDGDEKDHQNSESKKIDMENRNANYYKKYGFSLPMESKSRLNPKLQEMVSNITQKMNKNPDYDLNQYIQDEKKFRNPSIYDKLIQYCGINELGSNFSPNQWDVSIYGPESFYEELAKAQKSEMDKQEKQKKDIVKTEVIVKEGKRVSKWDVQSSEQGKVVPTSGKTTTVINAFGTLKKPKV